MARGGGLHEAKQGQQKRSSAPSATTEALRALDEPSLQRDIAPMSLEAVASARKLTLT